MLLAVRLVDLGTLITMGILEVVLLSFAFFLYRWLWRTGGGYVPPDVSERQATEAAPAAPSPTPAKSPRHRAPTAEHAGDDEGRAPLSGSALHPAT